MLSLRFRISRRNARLFANALLTGLFLSMSLTPLATPARAETVAPPFNTKYTLTDLGSVPGVPTNYGGLTFLAGDPNTLLIGGAANGASGKLYSIGLVRDGTGQITGFSGTAALYADAAYNDGGVVYGPGGVLFLARWPVNGLGQTKPGSSITDKIIDLTPFGVASSLSALSFVPPGFPGAGQLKFVTYSSGDWYTAAFSPDGSGTYNIDSATHVTQVTGAPEGFVYVPPGSPLFTDYSSMLISEYGAGNVAAYRIDSNGDPIPVSRADFIVGLSGAEGATFDPITGDFLFSTFGGNNHVVTVHGFAPPVSSDLAITKDAPGSLAFGSDLTYSITVRNNGPSDATGVATSDPMPPNTAYVSSSTSVGSCKYDAAANSVDCVLGSLKSGDQVTITIVVHPTRPGAVQNTVTVTGAQADPASSNNSATASTTVNPPPPPALTVSVGPGSPAAQTSATRGTTNVPMLQLVLTAGSSEPVLVSRLTLAASGTANDATIVTAVRITLDANGNGKYDTGEALLGTGTYSADDGTLALTFSPAQAVPAGGSITILVTYDIAP